MISNIKLDILLDFVAGLTKLKIKIQAIITTAVQTMLLSPPPMLKAWTDNNRMVINTNSLSLAHSFWNVALLYATILINLLTYLLTYYAAGKPRLYSTDLCKFYGDECHCQATRSFTQSFMLIGSWVVALYLIVKSSWSPIPVTCFSSLPSKADHPQTRYINTPHCYCDLDLDLMTSIYKLDPYIFEDERAHQKMNYLCQGFQKLDITDRQIDRQMRLKTFSVAGPAVWNSLPTDIRSAPTLCTFKNRLKTHLFLQSYLYFEFHQLNSSSVCCTAPL